MASVSRGKSNWANASARSKARKAGLIDSTQMRQLLLQEPDAMASSISEMGYRADLDLYATRLSGADLVEAALNHNMDRDLNQVQRFCQGHLGDLVSIYVERYTYQKVKTALRAVRSGVSDEVVSSQVLPEENEANKQWLEIVKNSNNLSDAVSALSVTKFGKVLSSVEDSNNLMALEDALDRHYYHDAIEKLRVGASSHPQLLKYLRTEIDHRNVINLFRSLKQDLSSDKRNELMLQGGHALNSTSLKQAAEAETEEALIEILRRAQNFNDSGFDDALIASREKGTLDPIVNNLVDQRMVMLARMSILNPLSAFPVINYVERKACEVSNLRMMIRGRAAGLSDEVIEAHLRI
jgi:V/A-type H+-transporting ATPase subunit C